jgi:hypothetical protein
VLRKRLELQVYIQLSFDKQKDNEMAKLVTAWGNPNEGEKGRMRYDER